MCVTILKSSIFKKFSNVFKFNVRLIHKVDDIITYPYKYSRS
ncbi:hypothetical protein J2783_001858 [Chryseobacterium sediminis]|nr:hypothetical protein [Chryseobacterium sediminis]